MSAPAAAGLNQRVSMTGTHSKSSACAATEPPNAGTVAAGSGPLQIDLSAVITALRGDSPQILVVNRRFGGGVHPATGATQAGVTSLAVTGAGMASGPKERLPYGPFTPQDHRTLEIGLREWVRAQTGLTLGYVEQLYTFADRGRHTEPGDTSPHVVSIGYVSLVRIEETGGIPGGRWLDWYHFLPWEDWRDGRPPIIDDTILPRLQAWARDAGTSRTGGQRERALTPSERLKICFAGDGGRWDDEKVLERYELLYEAGLVAEAVADGRTGSTGLPEGQTLGQSLAYDHRRIMATAISRLRAKLKYRPVIFEVMPPEFTLFELQKAVEAFLGSGVHKQNFRRLVENAGLVEATGGIKSATGGRPARLYRFRRTVLMERPSPGVRVHSFVTS